MLLASFPIDANGNVWSGVNWMPGSQSGVASNIGGGTTKFAPDGTALSPAITGFTGMGLDGVGWGTGVSLDKVWIGGLNGTILVMDFDGRPIGKESDFSMAGQLGGLMGVGVAANGDVWIADGTKNQHAVFPRRTGEGRTHRQCCWSKVTFRRRDRCPEPRLGQQLAVRHGRAVSRR